MKGYPRLVTMWMVEVICIDLAKKRMITKPTVFKRGGGKSPWCLANAV